MPSAAPASAMAPLNIPCSTAGMAALVCRAAASASESLREPAGTCIIVCSPQIGRKSVNSFFDPFGSNLIDRTDCFRMLSIYVNCTATLGHVWPHCTAEQNQPFDVLFDEDICIHDRSHRVSP